MPVTTRISTFVVGNLYKPSFATITGWVGGRSKIRFSSGFPIPKKCNHPGGGDWHPGR